MAEDVKDCPDELPYKRPRIDGSDQNHDLSNTERIDRLKNIHDIGNTDLNDIVTKGENSKKEPSDECERKETDQNVQSTSLENLGRNGNGEDEEIDRNSDISELSDMSGLDEEAWAATAGSMGWIQQQMLQGENPRTLLSNLIPDESIIPDGLDDLTLWKIIVTLVSEPPRRDKLTQYNTLDDALQLIKDRKRIVVLTGAGVSVSCGIPDFRSRNGIYARLAVDFPNLPDPQAMFDIKFFKNDQRPFYKFAKEIYPGQFEPSRSHKFISLIEHHGKLLRNYTQNIDTLEQVAGIKNVIQCHGSFAKATCMACGHKVDADEIREDIFNQVIPRCKICPEGTELSVIKPDIVFFGESLPEEFHNQMSEDKEECDLLIVIGSSLKVRPVALIPNSIPASVPQILINREPLKHLTFDIELLGDCDVIVAELCQRLGEDWQNLSMDHSPMAEISKDDLPTPPLSPVREGGFSNINSSETDGAKEKDTEPSETLQPTTSPHIGSTEFEAASSSKGSNDTLNLPHSNINSNNACDNTDNQNSTDPVSLPTSHPGCVTSDVSETNTDVQDNTAPDPLAAGNNIDHSTTEEMVDEEMRVLRSMWEHKSQSIAKQLKGDQYLFLPPNRYVFPGAEVYSWTPERDTSNFAMRISSSSSSSLSSSTSNSSKEDDNHSDDQLGQSSDEDETDDHDKKREEGISEETMKDNDNVLDDPSNVGDKPDVSLDKNIVEKSAVTNENGSTCS
ncbi:hypothetical protein FSP39_009311 [Pinctada imbricata]|uniref:protein acetyllysine N-acetyltransferase n=1 Tax=Pinctada imbricata TaxID=66713 RepID=A0AA89BQC9_PINIB|nr:hypothetical protein FSP39_009311 [Pinctada imbricata]